MDTNTAERDSIETYRYRAQRSESWRKKISQSMKAKWRDDTDYQTRCSTNKPPLTKGENHPNWQGGRHKDKQGYVRLTISPDHPLAKMAQSDGKSLRILEHRLVIAEAIARPLTPVEIVHHRNGKKDDNRLENLLLLKDNADHLRLHALLSKGFSEEEALAGLDDDVAEVLILLKALADSLERLRSYQALDSYLRSGGGTVPWSV